MLAVGATGLLLLLAGAPVQEAGRDSVAQIVDTAPPDPSRSVEEATTTVRELGLEAYALLPKVGIAVLIVLVAAVLARLARMALERLLGSWSRASAASALAAIAIWLIALGAALSVVAGDARALVGSVGLFGLALSWALQAPIESFAGWLMNSFRGYYRVGDRIAVGDAFGDVYRIDFLTTTVWEAGGPEKPVQGAQATGALITFPNSEVLRSNIVNYTRDFPYVWDEVTVGVANESDLPYAADVVRAVAGRIVGEAMEESVRQYEALLRRENLAHDVSHRPEVYVSATDAWVDLTVRYLVPARQRRTWATRLFLAINADLAASEHGSRILPAYPRMQVQVLPAPAWPGTGGAGS